MTDEEIDALTIDQLDIAVAEANDTKHEDSPWWVHGLDGNWYPRQYFRWAGGNIAVALLDRLAEWGGSWAVVMMADRTTRSSGCPYHGGRLLEADANDLPVAVARLFLRVVEARKGGPP